MASIEGGELMRSNSKMQDELEAVLAAAYEELEADCVPAFGHLMLVDLDEVRRRSEPQTWRDELLPQARRHPVYQLALECPFSHRSTQRPRGYAGDAKLIDFLYDHPDVACEKTSATDRGRDICGYWRRSPAAAAVRYRRDYFRKRIFGISAQRHDGAVLSIACGHLRELPMRKPQNPVRIFGIDQDPRSVKVAELQPSEWQTSVRCESIRRLIRGDLDLPPMTLIYASGLFDYLSDSAARRLISSAYRLLEPGGSLYVTNFLPSCRNRASMEYLQDWFLIYRDREQLQCLVRDTLPRDEISLAYSEDPFSSIGYLRVLRHA